MRTEVENAIHAALARCPQLETPSVNIHVEDGTVTLSGCVGAWTEKLAILEAVRRLPGSQAVEDALQIAVYL